MLNIGRAFNLKSNWIKAQMSFGYRMRPQASINSPLHFTHPIPPSHSLFLSSSGNFLEKPIFNSADVCFFRSTKNYKRGVEYKQMLLIGCESFNSYFFAFLSLSSVPWWGAGEKEKKKSRWFSNGCGRKTFYEVFGFWTSSMLHQGKRAST